MTIQQAMETMSVDEYLGWIEYLEERAVLPTIECQYIARLSWHVAVLEWRLFASLGGGEGTEPPNEDDFILKFRNRLDPKLDKEEEEKAKASDKDRKLQNANIQAKRVFVAGIGAKTPQQIAKDKEKKVRGRTRKPPNKKK